MNQSLHLTFVKTVNENRQIATSTNNGIVCKGCIIYIQEAKEVGTKQIQRKSRTTGFCSSTLGEAKIPVGQGYDVHIYVERGMI
jgi:hypothetical protein